MVKMLLVEDSMFICRTIQNISNDEYEIHIETDESKIIETVLSTIPDIVLLNMVLKNGYDIEICKQIKQEERLNEIPADLKLLNHKLKLYTKKLEENLELIESYAIKDSLTGLYNRRYLFQTLEEKFNREVSEEKTSYFFLLDIDDFKSVNDKYGHNIGDHVLKVISEIIRKFYSNNSLVCRWGGEEILVFTNNTSKKDIMDMCSKLLANIEKYEFLSADELFSKTATIGAALIDYTKSIEDNINNADIALYKGKRSGKNTIIMHK